MNILEHDLLLLMLNLSRMQDRERILRFYVEAVSAATPGVTVRALAPGEDARGELLDVATPGADFGRLVLDDPRGKLSDRERARLRNATRILAVILENVTRPMSRRSIFSIPLATAPTSRSTGRAAWRRPKARSWRVSWVALAAASAISAASCRRSSSTSRTTPRSFSAAKPSR